MIDMLWNVASLLLLTLFAELVNSAQFLQSAQNQGLLPFRSRYHTFQEIEFRLKSIASYYPTKTHLYTIGKSGEGRELWVLALANEKPNERLLLRPEVKYVSTMHGDEWWCARAKILMESTRIHLLFVMNPDGFVRSKEGTCNSINLVGRNNAYGVDLNRNFPDLFRADRKNPLQPETLAVMRWLQQVPFTLSANFHTGSLVINYPYDSNPSGRDVYSPTPDDNTFKFLALKYSRNHPIMHLGLGCDRMFPNGITNGAAWYYIKGGMMDYNYGRGVMATTIELACCKFPPASTLETEWSNNKDSLLEYLLQVNQGVRGIIVNSAGQVVPRAMITVEGRNSVFYSTDKGEFWRVLLPGSYVLKVLAPGSTQTWRYAVEVPKYIPGQVVRAYKVVLP